MEELIDECVCGKHCGYVQLGNVVSTIYTRVGLLADGVKVHKGLGDVLEGWWVRSCLLEAYFAQEKLKRMLGQGLN